MCLLNAYFKNKLKKNVNKFGQLVFCFYFCHVDNGKRTKTMEKMNYKEKEIKSLVGDDVNGYLVRLMEVGNTQPKVGCFGFKIGLIECFDGMAYFDELELGEYCIETLEDNSPIFKEFNACLNCEGKGYTEEINCSVYSGSDCCGGCYVEVECNCDEYKHFV